MKIKCDFCKTEYKIDRATGPVKCVVCGHTWTPPMGPRKNSALVFFASLVALLAAIVFTIAIVGTTVSTPGTTPMVAYINDITTTTDDAGIRRFVISGRVENTSDEIYGMPDLIVVSRDADGVTIASQKFMPSATLLEPGKSANFMHTLNVPTDNVKKINVELAK